MMNPGELLAEVQVPQEVLIIQIPKRIVHLTLQFALLIVLAI
jgi:hypothetical protein